MTVKALKAILDTFNPDSDIFINERDTGYLNTVLGVSRDIITTADGEYIDGVIIKADTHIGIY